MASVMPGFWMLTKRSWCFRREKRRAVHGLIAQGVAVEENRLGLTGIGRVCRIHIPVCTQSS